MNTLASYERGVDGMWLLVVSVDVPDGEECAVIGLFLYAEIGQIAADGVGEAGCDNSRDMYSCGDEQGEHQDGVPFSAE